MGFKNRDSRAPRKDRNFGPKRSFERGRSSDRPMMHSATCSNCGKNCQVPFKPTNGKPVFCSDCFESQGGGSDRRPHGRSFEGRKFNHERNMDHFDNKARGESTNNTEQYRSQFEALNRKLDKIIKLLNIETEVSEKNRKPSQR